MRSGLHRRIADLERAIIGERKLVKHARSLLTERGRYCGLKDVLTHIRTRAGVGQKGDTMITPEILSAANEFAAEPTTTYPGLRRFIEIRLEDAERAERASRGNVALDAVSRVSRFMDPEAIAAADEIWDRLGAPSNPLKYFEGKTYQEGLEAYRAALRQPPSRSAYPAECAEQTSGGNVAWHAPLPMFMDRL